MALEKPFAVLPLLIGKVRTGNERSNRPASNLGMLDLMGMTWRTDGSANAWAAGELFGPASVDFVSVIAANAQPGTTLRIRLGTSAAEVDGSSAAYDSGAQTFVNPAVTLPSGLYHSHREFTAKTVTHWRIDAGNHTGDFEAAGLVLGKRIEPSEYYEKDYGFGLDDLGELRRSRLGVPHETPGVVDRKLDFRLGWTDREEYEERFRPLIEAVASRGIVFWCFNPEPSEHRQVNTYLGYFEDPPGVRGGSLGGKVNIDFRIRSII